TTYPTTPLRPPSLHDALPICDEGQRADGHFLLARDPPPQPGFFRKRAKQGHARVAHQPKFLRKVSKSPLAKCSIPHEVFLFESRSEEHTSELQSRVDLVCRLL